LLLFLLGLGCPSTGWSEYKILHNFEGPPNDGLHPRASLTQDSTYLYGMTSYGYDDTQTRSVGVIFKVKKDGTDYTILHTFQGNTANDGANENGGLILSGSTLYGITSGGGGIGAGGTIFRINTDGSDYTILHTFGLFDADGGGPRGRLALSGSTLYGATYSGGGTNGNQQGVIFKINTDGSGYTLLHTFFQDAEDGWHPQSGLVVSGSTLYGTTQQGGGENVYGTLFKINTDGSDFTILHRFAGGTTGLAEGTWPNALALSGSTLYGTTSVGVSTIYKINTDGSGFEILYSLGSNFPFSDYGLLLSGSTLYGTANHTFSRVNGVVFKINTDGTGFTPLHTFPDKAVANDGYLVFGAPVLSGNTLYGTTFYGDSYPADYNTQCGTIFSLTLEDPIPWTLYDDFDAGMIDPEKWVGSDSGSLLRERSMLISSKRLNLLARTYGALDSNTGSSAADLTLTFANSPRIMGIKALVKPSAFEATACANNTACTSAEASLLGYFFNTDPQGNGSRKNDVFASIGVVRDSQAAPAKTKATVTARVGQCQDDACSTVTYLYSKALGKINKGGSATLSVEWDAGNHQFLFTQNSKKSLIFDYDPSVYPDEASPVYNNKSLAVTGTVANCQSSPRPTAFMNTFFDNVYVKALTP